MKNLIDYIIQEPLDDEYKRGHKYPFVSNELLNCDTQKILDYFTCTNLQLNARERKNSSVDSDIGVSNSQVYSHVDGVDTKASTKNNFNENEENANVDNDNQENKEKEENNHKEINQKKSKDADNETNDVEKLDFVKGIRNFLFLIF